jgi:hypothetical protein
LNEYFISLFLSWTSNYYIADPSRATGFTTSFWWICVTHLFNFQCCGVCLWFVCLHPVSCVPNVASVSRIVHSWLPLWFSVMFIYKNWTDNGDWLTEITTTVWPWPITRLSRVWRTSWSSYSSRHQLIHCWLQIIIFGLQRI